MRRAKPLWTAGLTNRFDGLRKEEAHMSGDTVLLRVVDGTQEGWRWMAFDEFLRLVSIEAWNAQQALVGMVLPGTRRETVH